MAFTLPCYTAPDFTLPLLANALRVKTAAAPLDGIAPENFHATSNHPEYVHLGNGRWQLVAESRMDCVLVLRDETLAVTEARRLKKDDLVVLGRTENGEEGILVYPDGFSEPDQVADKFSFRHRGTRETPFSRSYDELYDVLRHDRQHGLIEAGYCHALMAGNALATHDLEAALFRTGLGQDIYSQVLRPLGHYNHLDILNSARLSGSLPAFLKEKQVKEGIIHACEKKKIPYLLAGSIRDDGPLPGIHADVYAAQDAMRHYARKATTVIALATQLHAIAFGNMTPSYFVLPDGGVRPVFFYIVDMSEFATDKLANRGSSQARAILTNVQDFMINLWHNLR
jgi:hypothetical protein